MELATKISRLEPAAEIVSVPSAPGNMVFSAMKGTGLRCLVEISSWRSLPALDGVEYELDPRRGSDLILLPGDPEPSAVRRLLGQTSSPAPVIISQPAALGERADLFLCDWSASSLSAAILSLAPVISRVSELPRLPSGPDRDGLCALALAYTRDCSITPVLRPEDATVVAYPLLFGLDKPRTLLEELAEAELLRRRFFERLHVCKYCDSSRLHAREVCIKCHSSHLAEHSLIHHYACGWQAEQPAFEAGDAYLCPKCRKELRHYGVDYDKPGSVTTCQSCGETMSEPAVGFLCLDCRRITGGDEAGYRDWYQYDLLSDGVAALKSGRLPAADTADGQRGRSIRDFRVLAKHCLSLAQRTGRPLSAARLTIDIADLADKIGYRAVTAVCELIRDVAVQNIRAHDIAVVLTDTVLVCMPDTDETTARIATDRVQRAIFKAVHPKLKIKAEFLCATDIAQLLRTPL